MARALILIGAVMLLVAIMGYFHEIGRATGQAEQRALHKAATQR